jgi:hypothetical protein
LYSLSRLTEKGRSDLYTPSEELPMSISPSNQCKAIAGAV